MTNLDRCQAGFTLLELLVAMVLLGLLASLLYGGLHFGTRVWEKGNQELEQLEEVQTAQRLFRRQLSNAIPYSFEEANARGAITFIGTRHSLWFIGPSPAQSLTGGLYQLLVDGEDVADKKNVMLSFALLDENSDWSGEIVNGKTVTILEDIEEIEFAYFGTDRSNLEPRWTDEWVDRSIMPSLIRIIVRFSSGDKRIWPDLIVKPAVNLKPS